jgi:hypothetical protein
VLPVGDPVFLLLLLVLSLAAIAAGFFFGARQQDRGSRIAIFAATVIVGAGCLIALSYFAYFQTYDFLKGYVDGVARAFNLPEDLARAIAVLLLVPTIIVLGMVFSLSRQRRTLGVALVTVAIAGHSFLIWLGSREDLVTAQGEQLRCYTISEEGVRFFEREQIDPKTGERCQWVDETNARYIRAIDQKLRSGKPLTPLQFRTRQDVNFFATGTKGPIPLVWYHQTASGDYEFYDAPGVHPIFGSQLKPITPAIAETWLKTAALPVAESPSMSADGPEWSTPIGVPRGCAAHFAPIRQHYAVQSKTGDGPWIRHDPLQPLNSGQQFRVQLDGPGSVVSVYNISC